MREHRNVWSKVSCPERLSVAGPPALNGERNAYRDVVPFARKVVESFPDRVLWGTDWPHPNLKGHMPDDGLLVDFIPHIATTPELQQQAAGRQPQPALLAGRRPRMRLAGRACTLARRSRCWPVARRCRRCRPAVVRPAQVRPAQVHDALPRWRRCLPAEAICASLAGTLLPPADVGLPSGRASIDTRHLLAGQRDGGCRPRPDAGRHHHAGDAAALQGAGPHRAARSRGRRRSSSRSTCRCAWNGRSVQYGGGGFNGVLISGRGPAARRALRAAVAAGAGLCHLRHRLGPPEQRRASRRRRSRMNDEALVNFAHASYKKVRDVAVAGDEARVRQRAAQDVFRRQLRGRPRRPDDGAALPGRFRRHLQPRAGDRSGPACSTPACATAWRSPTAAGWMRHR